MKLNYLLLMAALTVAVHALLTHTGAQTGQLRSNPAALNAFWIAWSLLLIAIGVYVAGALSLIAGGSRLFKPLRPRKRLSVEDVFSPEIGRPAPLIDQDVPLDLSELSSGTAPRSLPRRARVAALLLCLCMLPLLFGGVWSSAQALHEHWMTPSAWSMTPDPLPGPLMIDIIGCDDTCRGNTDIRGV